MRSVICSTGSYLPERELTNEDLSQFPAASCKLIEQKTGVKSRRHASEGQATSDLATEAARACLGKIGEDPGNIDAIILATSSPDSIQPPSAARVQHALGAHNAFAFDLNSVCSGALFAIHVADSMIRAGQVRTVLIVAAELYSRILNPKDFSTYPYFGDGAAAVLVKAADSPGVVSCLLNTDGGGADHIRVPAGGSALPSALVTNSKDFYFQMNGRAVFEFAISKGAEVIKALLAEHGLPASSIKHFVSHQANINIIDNIAGQLGVSPEKFPINLDRLGNTAAASVLITFDQIFDTLEHGDYVVLVAFGGGLSWASCLYQHTKENI